MRKPAILFLWLMGIGITSPALFACDDAVCGNGIVEDGEACEPGVTVGGCVEAGYWGGTVGCTSECRVDPGPCERVVDLRQTAGNSCALSSLGKVYCWGYGEAGTNGDGTFETRLWPVRVSLGRLKITQITLAGGHACALDEEGGIACWGNNGLGQLGDGTSEDSATPRAVYRSTDRPFIEVTSTVRGTSALDDEGILWQWGKYGEDALGNALFHTVPVLVEEVAHLRFSHVHGYDEAHCAEAVDGRLWCWGSNSIQRLCDFDGAEELALFELPAPSGGRFAQVSMNDDGSCFLDDRGEGFCCGHPDYFGTTPLALDFQTEYEIVSVVLGMQNMGIVLDAMGKATVWRARLGELLLRYEEVVPVGVTATGVSFSWTGGCILDEKGYPWCNGYNLFGEVGVGHTNSVKNMIRILPPAAPVGEN